MKTERELILSIQPQHLCNILNKIKTEELRRNIPKNFKGWVNLYCTLAKPYLVRQTEFEYETFTEQGFSYQLLSHEQISNGYYNLIPYEILNGKIVGRFWFDEWDEVYLKEYDVYLPVDKIPTKVGTSETYPVNLKNLCLTEEEVLNYGNGKALYSWKIKNLEIFDNPLELKDFYSANRYAKKKIMQEYEEKTGDNISYKILKAPQSWQYVWRNYE